MASQPTFNTSSNTNISTTNISSTNHHRGPSEATLLAYTCIFMTITAIGVFGNLLVIVAVATNRRMRQSVMNLLLLNLAIADFLNLITCIPDWSLVVFKGHWLYGEHVCRLIRFVQVFFLFGSICTQLAVCGERFIAIVYPMRAQIWFTYKGLLGVIGLIWLLDFTFCAPYFIFAGIKTYPSNASFCVPWCYGPKPAVLLQIYKLVECILFYFVPLVITVILYSIVSKVLWGKNDRLFAGGTANQQQAETLKARQNVVKMLVACVCVYFLCYSPIQGIGISNMLGFRAKLTPGLNLALNALTMGCSAANPLLYTLFSQNFRDRFVELLCCQKKNRPSRYDDQTRSRQKPADLKIEPKSNNR